MDVESSWNVMAHGGAREGKWRGNWRMEWVASTLHTTSEHGVSSITTADAHTSAASSRLNWRHPGRFKWTRPFRRKTKSGFCACAITFQTQSTKNEITVGWRNCVMNRTAGEAGMIKCREKLNSWFQTFAVFWMLYSFFLGDSPASEFYFPTFRNTLRLPSS